MNNANHSHGYDTPDHSHSHGLSPSGFIKVIAEPCSTKPLSSGQTFMMSNGGTWTIPTATSPAEKYRPGPYTLVTEQPASNTKNSWFKKEEGKIPMAKFNDYSANAAVISAPSDTQVQRSYLLDRLAKIGDGTYFSTKYRDLRETFNMDVSPGPKTYKELIDAIKNDKFKLDEKKIKRAEEFEDDEDYDDFGPRLYGPMDGIIWDGPQPDEKGFLKAQRECQKAYTDTKDIIMVKDAEAALEALKAYENWKPQNAPSTDTVQ